jgi:hypothetical protein
MRPMTPLGIPLVHRFAPTGTARHFTTIRLVGLALALVASSATAGRADSPAPVTITASAAPKEVTIGDPIHYTVEVSAATDTELLIPVLAGQLGDFTITDFGEVPPRKENGRVTTARWYTLTTFESGDHVIPAPQVQYRVPGEALQEATGNEVLVGVQSLLAREPSANDIRDVRPPEEVPFDWRPYGVLTAAVVAAGLLMAGFVYFLNRPRRQYVAPPRPPHEIALAALNRLRAQHLVEQGRFDVFYVDLSSIVRRYLEDRFEVRAPEMTTEEFLSIAARDTRLNPTHRRLLGEFLSDADLVKFARHLPSLRDSEAAYAAARRFVDETKPASAGTAPVEEQDAAA